MPGFPLEAEDIASYAKKSPELGVILISTELKRIADDYVQEDVRAIEAQGRFSKVRGPSQCRCVGNRRRGLAHFGARPAAAVVSS